MRIVQTPNVTRIEDTLHIQATSCRRSVPHFLEFNQVARLATVLILRTCELMPALLIING